MAGRLITRHFEPSLEEGAAIPKRVDYPVGLRKGHIMLAGGREGMAVSGKKPRPEGTRWKEGPAVARTQSALLRQVRPGQRAWARGVMSIVQIEEALGSGSTQAELMLWIEDDGIFAPVRGLVSAIGQKIKAGTGLVFTPASSTVMEGRPTRMLVPYHLIGQARRIYADRPGRVAGDPALSRSPTHFQAQIADAENAWRERQLDAIVQGITDPGRPYRYDLTPFTSLKAVGSGARTTLILQTEDSREAPAGAATGLAAMNFLRSGAVIRPLPRRRRKRKVRK